MVVTRDALVAGDDADAILRNQTSQTCQVSNTTSLDPLVQVWREYGQVKWVNIRLETRDDRGHS